MRKAPSTTTSWRKSTYSGQSGPNCVQVALLGGAIGARDSKHIGRGHLAMPPEAWAALTDAIKR